MVRRLVLILHKLPYHPFKMYYSSNVVGSWSSKASLSLVRINYIKIAHRLIRTETHSPVLQKNKRKKTSYITTIFLSASVWHSALNNTYNPCVANLPKKTVFTQSPTTFFMTAFRCFSLMSFLKKNMTFVWGIFICWLSFSMCLLKGHLLFDRMEKLTHVAD